jgi:hypothetical protein
MNKKVHIVEQPRTAIVEAVKIVLKRAHGSACPECTLGMLLDELGFLEHEFVAAGLLLPCIVATKTTINWDDLMMAIEIKRSNRQYIPPVTNVNVKSPQERAHWLNEALKTGRSEHER